jgi:hypothetical protein
MGDEERRFNIRLVPGYARISVRKRRDREGDFDWAAILTVKVDGAYRAVCALENAHGQPERHRYRLGVKLEGEPLSPKSSPRLDLPAVIDEIKANWEGMVDRWEP